MSLTAGARLGPYEILSRLGAGGMGEVYRARDGRLNRTVAVKVLSDASAADADRRERFEREAKAISALDHPNICALYDVGEHEGIYFLVMPCLEGQTLADRLTKDALPPDQAIKYAIEIAAALDAAHRHGIIHRDLKPGNIMLTKTGVKLLDFGLAKLKKASGPLTYSGLAGNTTQAPGTGIGTLLGTMPYIAPEQIEGREVDARSDIFSLGAVIYEMITGQRAFKGESPASVIGAILKDQPPALRTLQPLTPPPLEHVVRTCLAKDPDERWQSAADIAHDLKWIREGGGVAAAPSAVPPLMGRMVTASLVIAIAITALVALPGPNVSPSGATVRFTVVAPPGTLFTPSRSSLSVTQFALSRDGQRLAVIAGPTPEMGSIWVRGLNDLVPRELDGTAGATDPFWSPDSGSVGFFAGGRLKIVNLATGELRDLCPASRTPRGGSWSPAGIIIFGGDTGSGLTQVSIATGNMTPVTQSTPQASSHRWPWFLADGRRFLYYARGNAEHRGVYVASLDGGEPARLLEGIFSATTDSGYLLTVREGGLLAYPFDERSASITGDPIKVVDRIPGTSTQRGAFDAAAGILVHGGSIAELHRLAWFDRAGRQADLQIPVSSIPGFRLSPDGTQLAYSRVDTALNTTDIWIADLQRRSTTRFTVDPANDLAPVWSPEGTRIIFRSDRSGGNLLYGKPATGGPNDEQLTNFEAANPSDWSSDGKYVLFHQTVVNANANIGTATLQREASPAFIINSGFDEYDGRFSPDGRWISYVSDESGRTEVYVQPFPTNGSKWTISTGGGMEARWRRDGREMFYITPDGILMAVAVTPGPPFHADAPRPLFKTPVRALNNPFSVSMDTHGDGLRFLIKTVSEQVSAASLTVVSNWRSELRQTTR